MFKRFLFMLSVIGGLLIMAACSSIYERVDADAYERIHRQLMTMESFAAEATVQFNANNNSHVYHTIQRARITGEYRIEVIGPSAVAGNTTVFDGATITQFNTQGRISSTQDSPERLEILLTSFVRNFITSQEVSVMAASVDESLVTILEAEIPGGHPYLHRARLWVDNETLLPIQLVIYGADEQERIVVSYQNFEYNIEIDDALFQAS